MNVYDFDDTIYQGDSTVDFLVACLKKPKIAIFMLVRVWAVIPFVLHLWDMTQFKSYFFGYIRHIDDIDAFLNQFVNEHFHKIKTWYPQQYKKDDVIISASPYFLVEGFCRRLGITYIYGTDMNKYSGCIHGVNCKGEAKVSLFKKEFGNVRIDTFYSDSKTDSPLARIANKAVLVKDNELVPWPKEWL